MKYSKQSVLIRSALAFILAFVLSGSACYSDWSSTDDPLITETPIPAVESKREKVGFASRMSRKYDSKIKRAAGLYLPAVDWRLYKSQLYQESLLDPEAVSPVGAAGIAQFMPATWLEVSRALGFEGISPKQAEPAIIAGAFYMSRMRQGWKAKRPEKDRHSLAMASYNAGFGNLLKAQKLCGGANLYPQIIHCLPDVTGHHSEETITYVKRIWNYFIREIAS